MIFNFQDLKIDSPVALEQQIKKIESMVRHSREYRAYVTYCREVLNLNFSQTWKNIDFSEHKLSLEIHHMITLYDIVNMVGLKMISELEDGEYLLSFDIAKKVIELHLEDKIPVTCLAVSEHEMVHAKLLEIEVDENGHNNLVHLGNYKDFINEYGEYLTEEELSIYKKFGGYDYGEGQDTKDRSQ